MGKNVSGKEAHRQRRANKNTMTRYVVIRLIDVLRNSTEQNRASMAVVRQVMTTISQVGRQRRAGCVQ